MKRVAEQAAFLTIAVLGLASCEQGLPPGSGTDAEPPAAQATGEARTVTRDVQRPDVFSTRELALWDGRPSLGGIWVAHPDVTDPERVIITNETTGQKTAGALFRRERMSSGPRLQLSSEAAEALDILAGKPTEVSVVVVRQEKVEVEPPAPVVSDEQVGAEKPGAEDKAAATAAGTAATTSAEKPRGNFLERLFGLEPRESGAADAAATAAGAAPPEVETRALDPVATGAATAIARAEAEDKPAPRPARASAPAAARTAVVQVGTFSVESNAEDVASRLRAAGVVPTVTEDTLDDKPVWRVIVGPVSSADDQAALLEKVRGLGYADAFLAPR